MRRTMSHVPVISMKNWVLLVCVIRLLLFFSLAKKRGKLRLEILYFTRFLFS